MLVDLELKKLYPLINKVVESYKPKNRHEKEELFAVALEGAWLAFKNYDESKSQFKTFLYNNMRWKILSYYKAEKKIDHPTETLTQEIPDNISISMVKDFQKTLSMFEQQVLDYRISGYTYKEIQEITGYQILVLRKTILNIQRKYNRYEKN